MKLKIFQERNVAGSGWCATVLRSDEAMTSPGAAQRGAVGKLVSRLKERHPDLDVQYYDPKCFAWIFMVIRYAVRPGEPTWVLDGRVIARGLPSFEELSRHFEGA